MNFKDYNKELKRQEEIKKTGIEICRNGSEVNFFIGGTNIGFYNKDIKRVLLFSNCTTEYKKRMFKFFELTNIPNDVKITCN